jgi:hypothetical protein
MLNLQISQLFGASGDLIYPDYFSYVRKGRGAHEDKKGQAAHAKENGEHENARHDVLRWGSPNREKGTLALPHSPTHPVPACACVLTLPACRGLSLVEN